MEREFFDKAFAKAAYLMNSDEFNEKVGIYEGQHKMGMNKNNGSTVNEFSHLEEAVFGTTAPQTNNNITEQMTVGSYTPQAPMIKAESKLPQAIINSFKQTPTPIEENKISGVIQNVTENITKIVPEKIIVPQPTTNTGIDYGVIKALIDESISRHLGEIKNQILNESSTLRGLKMCEGNKVQFLDTKGNIYEGVLTLKKKKEAKK